jgi:hypothetical protein
MTLDAKQREAFVEERYKDAIAYYWKASPGVSDEHYACIISKLIQKDKF